MTKNNSQIKQSIQPTNKPVQAENEIHVAPIEQGGPKGKEPTRYGDWEKNGKCVDF